MSNAAFDLFEEICVELSGQQESFLVDDDYSPLTLENLKQWAKEPATTAAVAKAIDYLNKHFEKRGSALPFSYDLATGRLTAIHHEYIDFVSDAKDQRKIARESKKFEVATSQRLATRLSGIIRRVGSPRTKYKRREEFTTYLVTRFGFEKRVLVKNDKGGGFDILWFPPLGAFPFRAMVSIQCKNSTYDRDDGFKSVGRAKQSFKRHTYAGAEECQLHCVLYNDYIDEKITEHARDADFVPLGISDLAPLTIQVSVEQL